MFKGWAVLLSIVGTAFFISYDSAHAQDSGEPHRSVVIQVKKSLPLSRSESPQKDYYLNVGATEGVQTGWIYPVYRRAAIHDPFFNLSKGDILVHVADLRVYHVENKVSVAKLYGLTDPSMRPVLDEPTVMVGDAFDVTQGRQPAAVSVGPAPIAPAPSADSAASRSGLSPEKALEVLEAYQKASAVKAPEIPSGSLFEDMDPNLQVPVEIPQTL